ncbi:hypothetical protein CMUST_15390 [Corynebacterium mustelae]|uniref:Uncharacterized protein n=1 Tax=Corynebacterium mustelae TaxID=571915 RepID=A0A0G3H8A2_9CORY|nr:hypothetical protein CMUST_15390 [Corynebacterium mustelae]
MGSSMKFTSNYYNFFGHRVRSFTKEIIPECLDLLDRNGMAVDVAHDRALLTRSRLYGL